MKAKTHSNRHRRCTVAPDCTPEDRKKITARSLQDRNLTIPHCFHWRIRKTPRHLPHLAAHATLAGDTCRITPPRTFGMSMNCRGSGSSPTDTSISADPLS